MIEPVQPRPIMTTSFAGSFCGMSVRSGFVGGPVGATGDAHRRIGITFVVALDPIAVVVTNAGEANHLPTGHVAIAAMDGVREEPFGHVLEQGAEEALRIDAVELDLAVFEALQRVILLRGGELIEAFAA